MYITYCGINTYAYFNYDIAIFTYSNLAACDAMCICNRPVQVQLLSGIAICLPILYSTLPSQGLFSSSIYQSIAAIIALTRWEDGQVGCCILARPARSSQQSKQTLSKGLNACLIGKYYLAIEALAMLEFKFVHTADLYSHHL